MPDREVESLFLEEFGATTGEMFKEFQFPSIAAASIGQVHRALLADGAMVAVKIQRPGIQRKFEIDNSLLTGACASSCSFASGVCIS